MNIHPRKGIADPDRLVSTDGKRSIRMGPHEMNGTSLLRHMSGCGQHYGPSPLGVEVVLITVTSLGGDGRGLVEFTSPVGRTHAEWQGTEDPRRGAQYRVEIEIPDEVSLLQDPQPLAPTGLLADDTKGGVIVSGTVEGFGDDGVVSLRVGSDVLLLELAEVSLTPELAQTVSLSVPRIELYPYEL